MLSGRQQRRLTLPLIPIKYALERRLSAPAAMAIIAPFRAPHAAPAPWRWRTNMRGDPGVLDFLNRGLRHELTAINQYWLHYRLLDNWGYKALAKQWRKESIEEMQHADKLVERIIFLDGFPNMQVLDPLHIGQNVKEVLDCDLASEMSARALYEEAATHCHAVKDYVSRDLFEKLMHDEEAHIDFLETQLSLVADLGVQLYAQHHIGELDEHHD
jgi:bacterioferritin